MPNEMMTQLGQYRLIRLLGTGGMAEVYEARTTGAAGFERPVCVKRILPQLAGDPEFRELFVKEAQVAGRLNHSNLVQVFDCVGYGDELAIVMELIDGIDLRHLIAALEDRGEKLPEVLVAYIAGQVLGGLRYAHERRVVHRDVSPQNVLISRDGEVKLTDFGIAKVMSTLATRTVKFKGKFAYMSPEQALAQPADHRTDLYSAGLVFYEMATGQRFFPDTGSLGLILAVSRAQKPTMEGVPRVLGEVIEQLLEPEQEKRFQSAEEALASLPPWPAVGPLGACELARLVRDIVPPRAEHTVEGSGSAPEHVQPESSSAESSPVTPTRLLPDTVEVEAVDPPSQRERREREVHDTEEVGAVTDAMIESMTASVPPLRNRSATVMVVGAAVLLLLGLVIGGVWVVLSR